MVSATTTAGDDSKIKEKDEQSPLTPPQPKEFIYADTGVKIGNGKYGPVNLIIHEKQLFALKIIPKETVDKTKRIEHIKNEKKVLHSLRKGQPTLEDLHKIEQLRKQAAE